MFLYLCGVSFFSLSLSLKRSSEVREAAKWRWHRYKVEVKAREEEQRVMGGSEDEMIKNLIKRVGMKRKRQANRMLNNVWNLRQPQSLTGGVWLWEAERKIKRHVCCQKIRRGTRRWKAERQGKANSKYMKENILDCFKAQHSLDQAPSSDIWKITVTMKDESTLVRGW